MSYFIGTIIMYRDCRFERASDKAFCLYSKNPDCLVRELHLSQISTRDIALTWESREIAAASCRRVDPEAHKLIRKA